MFNKKEIIKQKEILLDLVGKVNSIGEQTLIKFKKFEVEEDDDFYGTSLSLGCWSIPTSLEQKINAVRADIDSLDRILKSLCDYFGVVSKYKEESKWVIEKKVVKEKKK